ncbi:MAG: transposase [Saprospiraceae bacterium]|nr:transposase [Saprospiraceae bacterium]
MKDLHAFHVVLTTHNSRISQRMIKYRIRSGIPVELCLDEEILLSGTIGTIVKETGYQILAYNICRDHVHLLPVCQNEALSSIIQRIKSVSSKLFRRQMRLIP